jgi:hypothetical protein
MRDFFHKLIARLSDARRPLSRNRHFHTFANPHGRRALRASRHLRSLARDILAQSEAGLPIRVERAGEDGSLVRVLLEETQIKARRTAFLTAGEYEVLLEDPAVRQVLERCS